MAIYESPDGGKTIYNRSAGETNRTLVRIDPAYQKDQELHNRWHKLRDAVFMDDPLINELISKVEMAYLLKK